jgi:hypothetical protein
MTSRAPYLSDYLAGLVDSGAERPNSQAPAAAAEAAIGSRADPGSPVTDGLGVTSAGGDIVAEATPTPAAAAALGATLAPEAGLDFVARAQPSGEEHPGEPASLVRSRAGVERSLCRAGFSEQLARQLTDTALAHTLALSPRLGLAQAVRSTLAQRIPVAPPLPTKGCAIVLVGAGGSGKTTCCASLLAAYRSHSTMPARFATILAGEQADALELIISPQILEPVPADGPRARRELRTARADGVALIDTPRLSPSQPAGIRELARLLGELEPERVVVALPATLGTVAAEQLLASLEPLGASSVALTHADETDQLGVGIELACRFGLAPELVLEHGPAGKVRLKRMDPPELAASVLR